MYPRDKDTGQFMTAGAMLNLLCLIMGAYFRPEGFTVQDAYFVMVVSAFAFLISLMFGSKPPALRLRSVVNGMNILAILVVLAMEFKFLLRPIHLYQLSIWVFSLAPVVFLPFAFFMEINTRRAIKRLHLGKAVKIILSVTIGGLIVQRLNGQLEVLPVTIYILVVVVSSLTGWFLGMDAFPKTCPDCSTACAGNATQCRNCNWILGVRR
jgi:hypothetical protein